MAGIFSFGLFLLSVGCVLAEDNQFIELDLKPAGVLKKGDTFSITCSATEMGDFDILKIVRTVQNPKTGQDESIFLSTNGHLSKEFQDTGRYTSEYDYESSVYTVTITDAQGVDGGRLGCEFAASRDGIAVREAAMEYVTIYVPLEKLQIRSKVSDGDWVPVEDEGTVVMRDGYEDGVECYAETIGSDVDIKPKFTFTIGSTDGTTYREVEHDSELDKTMENKQLKRVYRTWYKFESSSPDKKFNGEEITCSASMEEYEAVTTTATLSVQYAPKVACRETTYSKLGEENVRVTCKATMNPEPTASFWSWGGANKTMLNTGDLTEGYSAEQTQLGDDEWEFHLVVFKVDESMLQDYKFSVENGLGEPVQKTASLEEVEETIVPEPSPSTKPPAPDSDPKMNEVIGDPDGTNSGTVTTASVMIVTLLLSALSL